MMVIAALLTSLTVAREWEQGTMEQLISTPVKAPELIVGKLIALFCIGLFDVLLAVLMGEFLFHVPLRGNVALIFGQAAIFLIGTLSLGLLISIVTKSQLLASQLAMVATFLPAFLLSGFAYPIRSMPTVLQWITYLVPAKYFVILLKGIYLEGGRPEGFVCGGDFFGCFWPGHVCPGQQEIQKKAGLIMFGRLKQILIKEFIQIFRDPRSRGIVFIMPIFQMVIFGYAVTTDVKHVATGIYDLDNSVASREVVARFVHSGYFDVEAWVSREDQIRELVDHGRVQALIRLNKGFEEDLKAGRKGVIQLIVDGTDSNTAAIVLNYSNKIVAQYSQEILIQRFLRLGGSSRKLSPGGIGDRGPGSMKTWKAGIFTCPG